MENNPKFKWRLLYKLLKYDIEYMNLGRNGIYELACYVEWKKKRITSNQKKVK